MAKNRKSNSKGFTLIELLIVIIIIGILAAIAFVAYGSSTKKAHQASSQSTLAQVKEKLAVYYTDNSNYPDTIGSVSNWLDSDAGGNSKALSQTYTTTNGFGYSVTPTGCTGDSVATGGAITAGTGTACTGFTLTAGGANTGYTSSSPYSVGS